jgi:hypothetical protein
VGPKPRSENRSASAGYDLFPLHLNTARSIPVEINHDDSGAVKRGREYSSTLGVVVVAAVEHDPFRYFR